MSFAKARIKRFNDISKSSPSPADYNVDIKQKPILGFMPISERFMDPKSPTPSEIGSTQSTPCFRTPIIIKKKPSESASKLKKLNLKFTEKELLEEKIVECKNKDVVIKELTEQLEELKNDVYNLNCKNERFAQEKLRILEELDEFKQNHNLEILRLTSEHDEEVSNLNNTISSIKDQLNDLGVVNGVLKDDIEKFKIEHKNLLELTTKEKEEKDGMINKLQSDLNRLEKEKEDLEKSHQENVRESNLKHEEEMQNIEFEMLKCVHEVQKSLDEEKRQNQILIKELNSKFESELARLKKSCEDEKQLINDQNIARIKQLEENMSEIKLLCEIQNKEKISEVENYWKSRLEKQEQESSEILKECQAISEYNIIQCEVEKNEYKSKLETINKKYNDLEKKYDSIYFNYKQLQSSYSNVQNKLYRLIKELREKEGLKNELNKLLVEKQTYETTILRSQETIELLKRRLRESDQDVEQLKAEIAENERKLLEYEQKFNILSKELQDAQAYRDELEMNNESTVRITREQINEIKEELLNKIDKLKEEARKSKEGFQKESEKHRLEMRELLEFAKDQQTLNENANRLIVEANGKIDEVSKENSDFLYQIDSLAQKNVVLQSVVDEFGKEKERWVIEKKELDFKVDILTNEMNQLRKSEEKLGESLRKIGQLEEAKCRLEEENGEQKTKMGELEGEVERLKKQQRELETVNQEQKKTIEEQRALIAPFKEQLESYELEMGNLRNAKNLMENEAKELGVKYAQILGHQNHKQKIKYMVNLKTKSEELLKANLDLESKLRNQEKKMEKLRKENNELKRSSKKPSFFEDKENIPSPNRSFKCESPGPLRELN